MRKIILRKSQYDDLVYPACTAGAAENIGQLATAVRLLTKLRNSAVTEREVISEELLREYAKARQKPVPQYFLTEDQAEFELEEDEFDLLHTKVKEHIHRVNLVAAVELHELITYLGSVEMDKTGIKKVKELK